MDTLALAEVDDLLLRQERVVLDLVSSRNDGRARQQLLEVWNAEVGNTNGLCLAGCRDLFQLLPRLNVGPLRIQITRAIGVLRNIGVIAVGVHWNRPVHQVQIDVFQIEVLQAGIQSLRNARVPRAPKLCGNEDIRALETGRGEAVLDTLADLVLVAVDVGGVNVSVTGLDGMGYTGSGFARSSLPCSYISC